MLMLRVGLVWMVASVLLVIWMPGPPPKMLHAGACSAIGQTSDWYAACHARVAEVEAEAERPYWDDIVAPRVAIIAGGFVVLGGAEVLLVWRSHRRSRRGIRTV